MSVWVPPGGGRHLDEILAETPVPRDFDFLSIDVDGNDYHVWAAVTHYRPKLVMIEYNSTMRNDVVFVQPCASSCSQGSSARPIVLLAKEKGYELVAATELNLLFADQVYFANFGIPDNSLELIRDDSRCPGIFVLYDGTVVLREGSHTGYITLPWHGLRLPQRRVQVLPRMFRRYPTGSSFGMARGALYAAWLALHAPGRLVHLVRSVASKGEGVGLLRKLWS